MSQKRDYYEVLGVDRRASDSEISAAYRKVALKYHPDRNPGDEEAVSRFKEAAEAFEVLSNAEKRARYDRFGHAGLEGVAGGAPHFRDISDIFEAFGDIFGNGLFGDLFGGRRRRRVRRGADVQCEVTLDLPEAARGATKPIQFQRHQQCEACKGSGAKPGTQPEQCRYCGGAGRVVQSSGIFSVQTTCPACRGDGATIRDPCTSCRGTGYVPTTLTREVRIPPGVDHGSRLRLAGEGEPSPEGGPPGDCYCIVRVRQHPLFERDGRHLICRVPITYAQAVLGTTLEVPTLEGPEKLDVPRGTQSGEVFKLRGRGMPDPRYRGMGDLLVQVFIDVPKRTAQREEELLRQLAEVEQVHVSPKRKSFFKKIKAFLAPERESGRTEE